MVGKQFVGGFGNLSSVCINQKVIHINHPIWPCLHQRARIERDTKPLRNYQKIEISQSQITNQTWVNKLVCILCSN